MAGRRASRVDEAVKTAKKHALRLVPYGLYLAGFRRGDGTKGISMVSWFTQTSFDPPLIVVGMHRESAAYAAVQETGVLALNILGAGQTERARAFFKHVTVDDGHAAGLTVHAGAATGCPVLPDLPAVLELERVGELAGGDHAAVQFRVVGAVVHDAERGPLTHGEAGLHYAG
jgi:flavin reductase (DIM6/NTAB) family NADH-FMN oxidoreductase RutF